MRVRRPARDRTDTERERWGYGVWGLMAGVIALFEIWAAAGAPPWPTISATVGHLEAQWSFVALIVVALIVLGAAHALTYAWPGVGPLLARPNRPRRGRTKTGRITMSPTPDDDAFLELSPYIYFPISLAIVIGGAWWIIGASNDKWLRGYIIYGLIAAMFAIIPNLIALFLKTDVPFPTLFRTIADLERRWHPVALVILVGLVILLIHLALYPWPRILQPPSTGSP
jgi:hypothetical protein